MISNNNSINNNYNTISYYLLKQKRLFKLTQYLAGPIEIFGVMN